LNPSELVPVLMDGDVCLNQSLAIIDYLDEQYPLEGKVRYSAALYEQDFIEYETLLEDYRSYEEEIY